MRLASSSQQRPTRRRHHMYLATDEVREMITATKAGIGAWQRNRVGCPAAPANKFRWMRKRFRAHFFRSSTATTFGSEGKSVLEEFRYQLCSVITLYSTTS